MKKHSQTDLVSRLKTRKILGVGGEDDDGEVHRSKISQVLGNEIKFAVREPLGLRVWQFLSAMLFSSVAIMALALPDQLYDAVFDGAEVTSKTPIRLYGGALLSISLIMWNALYTAEKVIIRWTLLTEACYFGVQSLVVTATLAETGLMSLGTLLLLASRLLFVIVSIYYYYQVGRNPRKCSGLGPAWAWTWARAAGDFTDHGSQAGPQAGRVYALPSLPGTPWNQLGSPGILGVTSQAAASASHPSPPYRDNSWPCLSWPLDS